MTGPLLLGFLTGLSLGRQRPAIPKALLATGFCVAYTTFSTFTYEKVRLIEVGQVMAAGNAMVSVVIGLAAAAACVAIGLAVLHVDGAARAVADPDRSAAWASLVSSTWSDEARPLNRRAMLG